MRRLSHVNRDGSAALVSQYHRTCGTHRVFFQGRILVLRLAGCIFLANLFLNLIGRAPNQTESFEVARIDLRSDTELGEGLLYLLLVKQFTSGLCVLKYAKPRKADIYLGSLGWVSCALLKAWNAVSRSFFFSARSPALNEDSAFSPMTGVATVQASIAQSRSRNRII
jgi:hypothetical protein